MTVNNVTRHLAGWLLFIRQFDFDIDGITIENADGLSRRPYKVLEMWLSLDPLVSFSTDRVSTKFNKRTQNKHQ